MSNAVTVPALREWLKETENKIEELKALIVQTTDEIDRQEEIAAALVNIISLKGKDGDSPPINSAKFELVAKDPTVIIKDKDGNIVESSGPAEPGAPPPKQTTKRGPYKKRDPKTVKPKRRPMKRARTMAPLPIGRSRAASLEKGRNVKNEDPANLPPVKRICKDCQERYPLDEFRALGGLNVAYGPPRERCRSCHNEYYTPKEEVS